MKKIAKSKSEKNLYLCKSDLPAIKLCVISFSDTFHHVFTSLKFHISNYENLEIKSTPQQNIHYMPSQAKWVQTLFWTTLYL